MNLSTLSSCADEKYIYLDQQGKATKRFQATVSLNGYPRIQVLVTCSSKQDLPSHSLTFLRLRTSQAMETYPMFSGLRNLQTINLSKKGVKLPQDGIIKDHLKSSDILTCNLRSDDIWLDVTIDCTEFPQLIRFQIKVNRSLSVKQLKGTLAQIINECLSSTDGMVLYAQTDIFIEKTPYDWKNSIVQSKNLAVGLKTKELEDDFLIGDQFTNLDRFTRVWTKLEDSKFLSQGSIASLMTASHYLANVLPIRLFRFQTRHQTKRYNGRAQSSCKRCVIF